MKAVLLHLGIMLPHHCHALGVFEKSPLHLCTVSPPNGPDQRLAAHGLEINHDDARESFASGGSAPFHT
jgi:hypothetical protein